MSIRTIAKPFVVEPIGALGNAGSASIATLTDGRFVIVWAERTGAPGAGSADDAYTDTDGGIFAQIYSASGLPVGEAIQVNGWTPGLQSAPTVAATIGGGFDVVHISRSQWGDLPAETDAFLTSYNAVGVRTNLGNAWGLEDLSPDNPPLGDDGDAVGTLIEGLGDGFRAIIRPNGTVEVRDAADRTTGAVETEFFVSGVTRLDGGNILISGLDPLGAPILRLSDASLSRAPDGVPGLVGPVTFYALQDESATKVQVTTLDPGLFYSSAEPPAGFAVSLIRGAGAGGSEIVVQTYTAWGTKIGTFVAATGLTLTDARSGYDIAALDDGTIAVAWTVRDASGRGIRVQHIDADGTLLGASALAHTDEAGDQFNPQLAVQQDGTLMLIYSTATTLAVDGVVSPIHAVRLTFESPGSSSRPTGGDDTLIGTAAGDAIEGLSGDDELRGRDGHDALAGGSGNDSLLGEAGNDFLRGDAGRDRLSGGDGNDGVSGQDGNDTLYGGNGNDSLSGGMLNDSLFGGAGTDSLAGNSGNDTLAGGRDADVFIFKTGGGSDLITDFDAADVLRLDRGLWAADGTLTRAQVIAEFASVVAGDVVFRFDGGEVIRLDGVASITAFDLQII